MVKILRLKSIELSGCYGLPPDESLHLDDLGKTNVLIGPNNSGKSITYRFLHAVTSWDTPTLIAPYPKPPSRFFWKEQTDIPVKAKLLCSVDEASEKESHVPNMPRAFLAAKGQLRINILITPVQGDLARFMCIHPSIWHHKSWTDLQVVRGEKNWGLHDSENRLGADGKLLEANLKGPVNSLRRTLKESVFYFDAIRALHRRAEESSVDDGSKLLAELQTFSQDKEQTTSYLGFKKDLIARLNALFVPSLVPPVADIIVLRQLDTEWIL